MGIAAQAAARHQKQVFQQLGFPPVPDFGAGAAYVCDGQYIQRDQVAFIGDPRGERGDDIGVGQVLLLRGGRHHQVIFDQPGDQLAVGARQAVLAAKPQRIDFTQQRVVAAASFRDVMKQSCEIKQFRMSEVAHQAAGERELVGELGYREAPQVAHDVEDVLVHGIDVIQVVLHLANDASERGNVATKDAVLIHAFELADDA